MKPVILKDAYKGFTLDLDKTRPPEETIRYVKEKFAEIELNILEETIRIDTGRLGIPVFLSICGPDASRLTGTTKQMGKGATPEQAEASAIMELVERFSFYAFYNSPSDLCYAPYANIKEKAIPFDMIAASVHDNTSDIDKAKTVFENLPMRWVTATNLTRRDTALIPIDWFFAINEFNGTSAGNCVEEAICQGICEVVERHVSALVSRDHMKVPRINPESTTDPMVKELLNKYYKNGIQLYLSDFSLDTGIPTVGILAYDPETHAKNKSEIVWTAGTTPSPEKALNRALTEIAQLAGDFHSGSNYVASGLPKFKKIEEAAFITNSGPVVELSSLPDISDSNIRVEVERMISVLRQQGNEIFVIETTHPELRIPSFYTIIPGTYFRERAENSSVGMFCAKIAVNQNQPAKALSMLSEMDQIMPCKYYLQFYLGQVLMNSGEIAAALSYFKKALLMDPCPQDLPSIYSYMGLCYKEKGDFQSAINVLEKGIEIDPERTDILNLMGVCHFKLNEHEKAAKNFEDLLSLNPSSAIDHANLAVNYEKIGRPEEAVAHYHIALSIDPGIGFARKKLDALKKRLVQEKN